MTTPTSHMSHLVKLAQTVTTSTPTHPATGGWSLFSDPGADSPLSEIENSGSPAQNANSEVHNIIFTPICISDLSKFYINKIFFLF